MNIEKIKIGGIPAIVWGEPSDKMIIAAHGSHSSKLDDCIWLLAQTAVQKGYGVISFDFPCHGERVYESEQIMPDECIRELKMMYSYACGHAKEISLFGCSMGAYFQLLAFADFNIDKVWFLSPVTDMERIILNLMNYCNMTQAQFKEKIFVDNDIEPLYYPYYQYVSEHPITEWSHKTFILRGENDSLCEQAIVKSFAENFGCDLTEMKNGEHWFHTDEQLDYFKKWLENKM